VVGRYFTTSFSSPINDREIIAEAEKIARLDGKSLSQTVTSFLKEFVQNNSQNNPISIVYKQNHSDNLEKYIDEGHIGARYWQDNFKKIENVDRLENFRALADTIHREADRRLYFLKTGRMRIQ
jgi:hypothetical protein